MADGETSHEANAHANVHVTASNNLATDQSRPTLVTLGVPNVNSVENSVYSPTFNNRFRPSYRANTARPMDIDDYFTGPRNIVKHSKWPYFLRLQGSVTPKMALPLIAIAGWATLITCISKFTKSDLGISSTLLTVIGFVVALALSFRSSTAYERYVEGRKYWAQLVLVSWNLARVFWLHTKERHEDPELAKADLIGKVSAINLINAYAVAIKHRLRFEPAIDYPDLKDRIAHLDTLASKLDQDTLQKSQESKMRSLGEFLGVSFATENPRALLKSQHNLGNLPLEILAYLSSYVDSVIANDTLKTPIHQTHAMTNITTMSEILVGMERVLNTPLPIAYSIAISQITHLYVAVLPFQLYAALGWITIPATIFAAYIILGLTYIGYEIENPFGEDVNDLPLDDFCKELACDLDILTSKPASAPEDWIHNVHNKVLYPLSLGGYHVWNDKSVEEIRMALTAKATLMPTPSRAGTSTEKEGLRKRNNDSRSSTTGVEDV